MTKLLTVGLMLLALLLQLLGLAWHRQLPDAILPEKLERAIQLSLPQLPEQLSRELSARLLREFAHQAEALDERPCVVQGAGRTDAGDCRHWRSASAARSSPKF